MEFYQCITDFIFMEHEPKPSDIIFIPGGNYPDAALKAAQLYHRGFAPYLLPSGKYSIQKDRFECEKDDRINGEAGKDRATGEKCAAYATECEYLCSVLRQAGVPEQALLREDQASFTYENAVYSRKCVQERGLQIERAILCCQAFHARRCFLYYQEQFPETAFYICPVVTKGISRESWHRTEKGIDTVLGELERCGGQFHEIMREHMMQSLESTDKEEADD